VRARKPRDRRRSLRTRSVLEADSQPEWWPRGAHFVSGARAAPVKRAMWHSSLYLIISISR
jgi:hypothetical protein